MRNATGKLLLVVGFPCDCCEVDEAESRGAWEAIRLMKEHFPCFPLWLEGDALSVTQKLLARSSSQADSVLLEDARGLLATLEVFKISYTYREGTRIICAY